eukprot:6172201-Pleurochrysis_carterae.AAC.2
MSPSRMRGQAQRRAMKCMCEQFLLTQLKISRRARCGIRAQHHCHRVTAHAADPRSRAGRVSVRAVQLRRDTYAHVRARGLGPESTALWPQVTQHQSGPSSQE